MEVKYNEATHNRPEGDRPIEAPMVLANIPSLVKQLKSEKAWKESDRNSITIFKSGGMRIVLIAMHKKAEMTTERPENILSIHVIDGRLKVNTSGRTMEVDEDQLIALQPRVEYTIVASKKTVFLLTVMDCS